MRILFFSYAFPNPSQPGLGTFNRTMLRGLAAQHEVQAVVPIPWPTWIRQRWLSPKGWKSTSPWSGYEAVPGVKTTYLPYYYPPKVFRDQYHHCLWWSVKQALLSEIAQFRPDAVLSYWAHPDGAVAVKAAHVCGIPAAVMLGGSDILVLGRKGARRQAILNGLKQADLLLPVSQDIAATLISDGIAPERIRVAPRGIDGDVFGPGDRIAARKRLGLDERTPLIVAVGRLVPVKDWPNLIQACQFLAKQGRTFRCIILGSGELQPILTQQIAAAGLQRVIELRGPQPQAMLADWYRAADVTALSSISEGIPNVLLESLACGTPFVATSVGGIPEIADQRFDRLVPPRDPQAFAAALSEKIWPTVTEQVSGARRFQPVPLSAATNGLTVALSQIVEKRGPVRPVFPVSSTSPKVLVVESAL
jgi:teichuronic acid biosynthesis glycosyltransferase TuaC